MDENKLIQMARDAIDKAYAPYSNFKVGACLCLKDGNYIIGSNVENASYGLCNCAERNAMFHAYNLGYRKDDIVALAVASYSNKLVAPCGACRQVMQELLNPNTPIYMVYGSEEHKVLIKTVEELIPLSFSGDNLNV